MFTSELAYLKDYNIQKKIDKFAKKYKNKKILIYGAGKLSDFIFKNYNLSKLNIIAVSDIKYEPSNDELFHGNRCLSPAELAKTEFDVMILFTKSYDVLYSLFVQVFKNPDKKHIKLEWILDETIFDYLKNKTKSIFKSPVKNEKYIFTFWEPKDKMPPYIKLCINTWRKFLPDYKIIILGYDDLNTWLGYDFYDEYLYNNFSLDKQSDAIRVALLYKYGGIWMDADTIVTSEKINEIINQKEEVTFISLHVGFIVAKKRAKLLKLWLKNIKKRIFLHKLYKSFSRFCKFFYPLMLKGQMSGIGYFGNGIICPIVSSLKKHEVISLNRLKYFALPEHNFYNDGNADWHCTKKYWDFYFNNDFSTFIYENEKGIIMLHNSWTPDKYKNMSEEEFLKQDCTLSKVLKRYQGK